MKTALSRSVRRERGAALMIALVFLVIMAMLGVTIANVTTLQERMAGHTRDRDLALQAAEAALRDAEERLADDPAFRAAAIGFVLTSPNDDAHWETCFAGSAGACAVKYTPSEPLPLTGAGAVVAQPQYVLERMVSVGTTEIYRVTARAVGGTDQAIVVLQAEFGFTPPP